MMGLGMYPDPQAGDAAIEAVARFLHDTTRMLDWLLSTYVYNHSDARNSLSVRMPSVSPDIGFGHGVLPTSFHSFYCSPYRSSVPYHGDPRLDLQQWFCPRAIGSTGEGGQYPNAGTVGNGARTDMEKLVESISQTTRSVNRDVMKAFLEDMKGTVQEWSVKHSLLVEGAFKDAKAPLSSFKPGDSAVVLPKPVDDESQSQVQGPPLVMSNMADMATSAWSSLQQKEATNMFKAATEDNSKTLHESGSLESQHAEPKTLVDAAPKSQNTETKTYLGAPIGRVMVEIASQLFHGDGERVSGKMAGSDKRPSSEIRPVVAPEDEKSLEIDGEAHVIFTTPTAKENAFTSFESLNNEADSLRKALVTTCASVVKRKKLPIVRPRLRQPREVVSSPDWLPPGWVTEVKTRGCGNSAGCKDKYYVDPISKRRFRSRKEVFAFLETGSANKPTKAQKIPVQTLLGLPAQVPIAQPVALSDGANKGPAATDTAMNLASATEPMAGLSMLVTADKAERPAKKQRGQPLGSRKKPNAGASATTLTTAVTTAITPMATFVTTTTATASDPVPIPVLPPSIAALPLCIGMPTGQPSNWVYESVATLPFPMYDPFYFSDFNINKVNESKGAPTRPWFFTAPEASWQPSPPMGKPQYAPSSGTLPKH